MFNNIDNATYFRGELGVGVSLRGPLIILLILLGQPSRATRTLGARGSLPGCPDGGRDARVHACMRACMHVCIHLAYYIRKPLRTFRCFFWCARKEASPTREGPFKLGRCIPQLAKASGHIICLFTFAAPLFPGQPSGLSGCGSRGSDATPTRYIHSTAKIYTCTWIV